MEITRTNCETVLCQILGQTVKARIRSASTLLAVPPLRKALMMTLSVWCTNIGCRQGICLDVGRQIGMDLPMLVSDFINHTFRAGKKGNYPTLSSILTVAHQDGAEAVPAYLMQAARNRVLDLRRRYEVRASRQGNLLGFTQDDEFGVIDAGEGRDDNASHLDEDCVRQEALARFLATMGRDPKAFASDLCILSDAVGIKRALVCQLFFAGRQTELVAMVAARLSDWLHRDVSGALSTLAEQARAYVLPARLKGDQEALLGYLYRQSSGAARARLAERRAGCGL